MTTKLTVNETLDYLVNYSTVMMYFIVETFIATIVSFMNVSHKGVFKLYTKSILIMHYTCCCMRPNVLCAQITCNCFKLK